MLWMRLVMFFFALFPKIKKSAKLGSHSGSELLPESSPSSRRAYAVPMVPEVAAPVLEGIPRMRTLTAGGTSLAVCG